MDFTRGINAKPTGNIFRKEMQCSIRRGRLGQHGDSDTSSTLTIFQSSDDSP